MRSLLLGLSFVFCLTLIGPAARAAASPGDPLEPLNRKVFWFNEKLDGYVLEPVARGWKWLTPAAVRQSVSHFFDNIRFPVIAVNDLLQGKFAACGSDIGRFAVNTTVGVLGFMDPATGWGLEKHDEDFGQTLGVWGVPPGPYLVLPLLGASNPRDTAGMLVDSVVSIYPWWFVPIYYSIGPVTLDLVNYRAQILDEVREAKRAAVDYYAFVRDAYVQLRRREIADTTGMSEKEQEELYYLDEE